MISQTAEYALRAMVVLLTDHSGVYCSSQDVAQRAKVPPDYMSKILNALAKVGLVTAQRGRNGGCRAARPATDISVLEIVQAVDPIRRILTCPAGIPSHGTYLCPLHRKLDDAARTIEQAFSSTTMAELLSTPSRSRPLCDEPALCYVQVANS